MYSMCSLRPRQYESALGIGQVHEAMRNYPEADRWYSKSIDARTTPSAWAYGNYAVFLIYYLDDVERGIVFARKALSVMNFGVGRLTLAVGLYSEWARLVEDGKKGPEVDALFSEASRLVPDLGEIFRAIDGFSHLAVTARQLAIRGKSILRPTSAV